MNSGEPISIVCASNDNFIVLLAVLMKSIEKQNTDNQHINFYLISDNIKQKNKEKLEKSIQSPLVKIKWITLCKDLLSKLKFPNDYSTYPKNIYSRLLISYCLPKTLKKVLYLDADMMLNVPVSKLWNISLENKIIGAVQEPNVKCVDCPWSGVKNYAELNIPPKAKYFNSGLLLIDLEKWREENIAQKVVECVENNKKYAGQPDQYGLNAILWDKWKELEPGWNHYSNMESENLPYNIHFVIKKPIFSNYNGLPLYKNLFYDHLKDTQWKKFKPMGEFRRKLIKLSNVLEKVF